MTDDTLEKVFYYYELQSARYENWNRRANHHKDLCIIEKRTGKTLWVVQEDVERGVFMSAKEAQAFGMVHIVGI